MHFLQRGSPLKAGIIIIFTLLMGLPALLSAQEDDPYDDFWDNYVYELFAPGDQVFMVSLGIATPTVFYGSSGRINHQISSAGGTGTLVFNYYLSSKMFVGAEVSGMFLPTIGGSTLYTIPLGARVGTHFITGRFEFPVAVAAGVVWHTYLDFGNFSFFAKASASALYRVSGNWAFGVTASWYFFPQFTSFSQQNVFGNVMDINLTARYQF